MKTIKLYGKLYSKLLTIFFFGCAALCTGCANAAQEFKTNAEAIEDLNNLQNLLTPIKVMGYTFELEQADVETDHKSNTYKTNDGIPKKIIYVDEYEVKKGIDRFSKAKSYVQELKNNGEDARIFETNSNEYALVYSTHSEEGLTVLAVSKFYDTAPNKILQNEYCLILSDQQNNEKSIRKIINDFMKADMINIRHIIIRQVGNTTDIRSY